MEVFYIEESEEELYKLREWEEESIFNLYITDNEKFINTINEIYVNKFKPKRGDIIIIRCINEERNLGKLIYDGKKIIYLYSGDCEHGAIPPSFNCYDEFPITYWSDYIYCNTNIYVKGIKSYELIKKNAINYTKIYQSEKFIIIITEDDNIDDIIEKGLFQYNRKDNNILYSIMIEEFD